MQRLPKNLYLASQVREFDRRAIEDHEIPGYTLMSRAGEAVFAIVRERWPAAATLAIVCGAGNNAGDGLVVARLAMAASLNVHLMTLRPGDELGGDAATAWQDFKAAGGEAVEFSESLLESADVIVDGILGTGLDRPVGGSFADAIDSINEQGKPVLALDIPSGMSADTGLSMGTTIKAAVTVSFVALKAGLFLGRGPGLCGEIFFAGLNVPDAVYDDGDPVAELLQKDEIPRLLPPRAKSAHKGKFGHVLIVGGGPGMPGAACLAGEAALRSGAGLVSVATHPEHLDFFAGRPELMCHGIDEPGQLAALVEKADVIALGPGLGQSDWAKRLWGAVIAIDRPLVIDADGLNWLAQFPAQRNDWILTPHPGEAARLLDTESKAIQEDRLAAVLSLQKKCGGVAVLKGAGTLINDGHGLPALCRFGNPGMAGPGMGDVLTGLIAGLLAQTRDVASSARVGVLVHALAGDDASGDGERGLVAGDLMDWIRKWVNPKP
ncbi:MAG: NAD(P)H-hydrate dehydratase [Gammaproteobacteria bacterium]|nr:NAD(P)H-hydrate dehydratase [Gammaproteobacteria bacterium]